MTARLPDVKSGPGAPAGALRQLRQALVPALLFWLAWAVLHWRWPHLRWVSLAAQMWVAYSVAWLVLLLRARAVWLVPAAAVGGLLGLVLAPGFGPAQWFDVGAMGRQALPATAFALLMHLPMRWWRRREERAVALRLSQAEHAATMAELSRQVSVAELKALQAQVEPHFLFNALASLQQLIRHDAATAERFLGELHDYLRLALPSMREPLSTVEKELALARAYLTVMATRLGERLQFELRLAPDCAGHPMPPMMLLTLVENAVRHGIETLAHGGRVEIEALRDGANLVLEVRDNGAGLQAARSGDTRGQGVGLANVRDRLAALYGAQGHLSVRQRDEGGVCARMALPWSVPVEPASGGHASVDEKKAR
jgi:signal transduction histidine kinase